MALISVSAAALRAQGFFLLLLVCGTSWAMERPKAQNTDFAFAFQCQDGKSCLIGEFPKNLQITLLSPKGVVCHAKTLDVYEHEGPVGPIPVTRLDTSGCQPANFALAWLAPEKEALQFLPLQALEDRQRLAEIQKRVLRSPSFRFNEKQWLKDNPDPDPNEIWPEAYGRNEWLTGLAYRRHYYGQFKQTPLVYPLSVSGKEVLILRYSTRASSGPLLVDIKGKLHLLERIAAMPTAFSIGGRKYLYFSWMAGEGGLVGTAIWQINENGAEEVANDASFAT
jgi:hypothetical protein